MGNFHIYCDSDEFSAEHIAALESAMDGFVTSDVTLAIEFLFVEGEEIRRLNSEQRGIDKVTDVLSFPALDAIKGQAIYADEHPFEIDEEGCLLLGSVVVCCDRAKEQAEEYGHSFEREVAFLTVHSVLHLLGYDHEASEDAEIEMFARQEEILKKMKLDRA